MQNLLSGNKKTCSIMVQLLSHFLQGVHYANSPLFSGCDNKESQSQSQSQSQRWQLSLVFFVCSKTTKFKIQNAIH